MHPFASLTRTTPRRPAGPAGPDFPALEHLEGRALALRRRVRAEQPAAGQRRRRLEGLRRRWDRRPRQARDSLEAVPARRRHQPGRHRRLPRRRPGVECRTDPAPSQSTSSSARPGGFPAELDLHSLDGTTGYVIDGVQSGPGRQLPAAAAATSTTTASRTWSSGRSGATPSSDREHAGQTFVLFGGTAHLAALDLADGTRTAGSRRRRSTARTASRSTGRHAKSSRAPSTVGGDVNGDDVDDLVIGTARRGQRRSTWSSAAIPRRASPSRPSFELATLDGSNGFVIRPWPIVDDCGRSAGRRWPATSTATGSPTSSSATTLADPSGVGQRRPGLRDLRPDELPRHLRPRLAQRQQRLHGQRRRGGRSSVGYAWTGPATSTATASTTS